MVQYERPYQVNVKHENQQKFMSTAYIFQKKKEIHLNHTLQHTMVERWICNLFYKLRNGYNCL